MSAYYHTCVLILLHMSPLTTLYTCPHTTTYVSSSYFIYASSSYLIYVSSYSYICSSGLLSLFEKILLRMFQNTPTYAHTPTYAPVDYSPFSRNDPMARGCPEGLACRGGRGGQENRDDMFACGKRGDSSPELIMSNRCLYMRVVLQTYRRATYVASCSYIIPVGKPSRSSLWVIGAYKCVSCLKCQICGLLLLDTSGEALSLALVVRNMRSVICGSMCLSEARATICVSFDY